MERIVKRVLYICSLCIFVYYLAAEGIADVTGFFTLGTEEGNAWLGIEGDNSVIMMLKGILAFIIIILYASFMIVNVKRDIQRSRNGEKPIGVRAAIARYVDKKFYVVALALPVIGVCIFNIIPIIFMILIAFTNYGGEIVPPKLVDWVGFQNFKRILVLGELKDTFFKILGWNIVWAVLATLCSYFGGLGLALLLNKKCVKGKTFWRAFPILAYALPGFITLLAFKFMFAEISF